MLKGVIGAITGMAGAALVFASCGFADQSPVAPQHDRTSTAKTTTNLYFIGQDLDGLREYFGSECCVAADGATAYIGLYNVLSEEADFGGIGLNLAGEPIDLEGSWGAGPVSAYKTATEFGAQSLAIGLFVAENDRPNAISELLNGEHDDKIRHLAKLFSYVEGEVFLRIGYEFDGVWNTGYENTDQYKAAWRRIVDVLRASRADNVVFVWQASASPIDDIIERKHEDISAWYPGDDYVDWVGLSWFSRGDEEQRVDTGYDAPTPGALAEEVLALARERGKPVMIAESAPQGYDLAALTRRNITPILDGPSGEGAVEMSADMLWDAWFTPFFEFITQNDDVIDAVAYINVDWDAQLMWGPPYDNGYWGDTRINANAEITQRWNEAITAWRAE